MRKSLAMKSRIPNEAQPTYHNQPNSCHFEDIRALGNFKAFSKVFASCFFTFGSSGGGRRFEKMRPWVGILCLIKLI